MQWSGQGNHLDITGPSWVVMSAGMTPALTSGDHRPGELVEDRRRGGPAPRRASASDRSRLAPGDDPSPRTSRSTATGPLKAGADPDRVGPKRRHARRRTLGPVDGVQPERRSVDRCKPSGALLILAFLAHGLRRRTRRRAAAPPSVAHDDLQKRLGDANLRLLDARPRADYDKGHIPGAVWVDAKAAQTLAARPGGLTDRAAWEAWLAPLGIAPRSEVLVYDDQRQLEAARIWWLLRYLGVERSA